MTFHLWLSSWICVPKMVFFHLSMYKHIYLLHKAFIEFCFFQVLIFNVTKSLWGSIFISFSEFIVMFENEINECWEWRHCVFSMLSRVYSALAGKQEIERSEGPKRNEWKLSKGWMKVSMREKHFRRRKYWACLLG